MNSTETAQNILARYSRLPLGVVNPSVKLKRQHHRALQAIQKAEHELDILNEMKEELKND